MLTYTESTDYRAFELGIWSLSLGNALPYCADALYRAVIARNDMSKAYVFQAIAMDLTGKIGFSDSVIVLDRHTIVVYDVCMDKIRVNIFLGEKQLATLKKMAKAEDTSVSRLIRMLVDEFLREKKI